MLHTKLTKVVKAVRFRYAALFVLLCVAVYILVIHPWMANWGSTVVERQMALTGDDPNSDRTMQSTLAITINAPQEVVWQWLIQIGQDRAGFYTYTWLENLVGADIHNVNEIHPEWQELNVGDIWRVVPPDYLWGVGKDAGFRVLIIEPGRALVLETMGAFVIVPINDQTSRLITRGKSGPNNLMMTMIVNPVVFTMERRMLLGLKARAEDRPDKPSLLTTIALLGWVAAGITVADLFISQRSRRYWLSLPVLVSLPALLMSNDIHAALAAFIAVGITVLGFLIYGRSWWGPFLIIGSVVLLTLLLTPEAYIAIGIAFDLLLLAALIIIVTGRSRTVSGTTHTISAPTR